MFSFCFHRTDRKHEHKNTALLKHVLTRAEYQDINLLAHLARSNVHVAGKAVILPFVSLFNELWAAKLCSGAGKISCGSIMALVVRIERTLKKTCRALFSVRWDVSIGICQKNGMQRYVMQYDWRQLPTHYHHNTDGFFENFGNTFGGPWASLNGHSLFPAVGSWQDCKTPAINQFSTSFYIFGRSVEIEQRRLNLRMLQDDLRLKGKDVTAAGVAKALNSNKKYGATFLKQTAQTAIRFQLCSLKQFVIY